jgi:hypothetical protein
MATRNGKIANLPNVIREQLNLRLLEGETGRELSAWLNALPVVQSILGLQFHGAPISEVNLTHWRQGGFLQWLTERECFDSARALAEGDCDLADTGLSAERLLNILTLRYGQLLMRWDLPPEEGVSETEAFAVMARKARILQGISRSVLAIHRIQSRSSRQKSEPATSSATSRSKCGKDITLNAALNSNVDPIPSEANGGAPKAARSQPSLAGTTLSAPRTAPDQPPVCTPEHPSKRIATRGNSLFPVSGLSPLRHRPVAKPPVRSPVSVQILSGSIIPRSIPPVLPQISFKPDLERSELLEAV